MQIATLGYANDTQQTSSNTAQGISATNAFDQDTFMKILVAQLKYQNPMSPQQDSQEMISQITQFSMLEQLTNLSQQMESLTTNGMAGTLGGMLGKEATYLDADGEEQTGIVEAVVFRNGHPLLQIDGEEVYPGALLGITLKEDANA